MKNLLFAVLTATLLLCSCNKEDQAIFQASKDGIYSLQSIGEPEMMISNKMANDKVSYEVKEGRIILANSDDFEDFLHILSTHNLDDWEQSISYQSYRTSKHLEELVRQRDYESNTFIFDDLELASLLNTDGVVQINPYLIKLDPVQQKVFVLDIQEVNDYPFLFNATQATNTIQEFSFDDDVWYLLENNLSSEQGSNEDIYTSAKICKELKSKNKGVTDYATTCHCGVTFWQQALISVWYNKFGIWETVKAQFANNHYDVYGLNNAYYKDANIALGFIYYYLDERCGPIISGAYQMPTGLEKNRIYIIRRSKKPLQRNKSTINMATTFNYIVGPPQGNQYLQTTLNNF